MYTFEVFHQLGQVGIGKRVYNDSRARLRENFRDTDTNASSRPCNQRDPPMQ